MEPKWLKWAKELQLIAQAGLTYSTNQYDLERFEQIRNLSVQIMSEYTDMDHEKIRNLFCNETGYQTPKVETRGAIFKSGKILLVQERLDKKWALPGGWAEVNLSIKENVIKEVKEESGLDVVPTRLIGIFDKKTHSNPICPYGIYSVFVMCDLLGGVFKRNIETLESRYFSLEDLPELSLERSTKTQIEICFNAHLDKNFKTIFD